MLSPIETKVNTHRIDVLPKQQDWAAIQRHVETQFYVTPCYWIQGESLDTEAVKTIRQTILMDPILEEAQQRQESISPSWEGFRPVFQKQFLPGVTDNLAHSVAEMIPLVLNRSIPSLSVSSGQVFWLPENEVCETEPEQWAYRLFNPLIERLTPLKNHETDWLAFPNVFLPDLKTVETIPLELDQLETISKTKGLALSLLEMQTIVNYYQDAQTQHKRRDLGLPVDSPTDVELEIIAQTWSEHCKHKIFSANIHYFDTSNPKLPFEMNISGLFKTYIVEPTKQLMAKRPDLLSIFIDNAGVVAWDDQTALCFKVETHNSPSALEPYGGALTGIVGVNRDILGTGLGAKPILNTDVFCFAHPEKPALKRPGMLPLDAIATGVRKGVEDGGNKSGIPTVNGSLFFDARYRAKPLVFCGTAGVMPREIHGKSAIDKHTQVGDAIVMLGGRVGKDGIHGANFSSEALTQDSPVSAVQIGDPLTQRRLTDFLLTARDAGLYTGITDNGAGGLSSSIGEMAQLTNGARIDLEAIPLKYSGLQPYEIMISESQERMSLSTDQPKALLTLAKQYGVEATVIGVFTDSGRFEVFQNHHPIAALDLDFLHEGVPKMSLTAHWEGHKEIPQMASPPADATNILLSLLAHPNVCSRESLIRQYDHEVQGRSVIKPLMGPSQLAPCDAAVLTIHPDQPEGVVISNGLCPQYSDWDTYAMATCAVDEAVRNAVVAGADPKSLVLLDNFCWPDPCPSERNPDAEHKLAQLVRACQGLAMMATAYETPFISGKDSMKNDYDDGTVRLSIPPTLLISAMGKIPNVQNAVTSYFKSAGDLIFVLGPTHVHLGGSLYYEHLGWHAAYPPRVDTALAKQCYQRYFEAVKQHWIRSGHDCSEGGLTVTLAECTIGSGLGAAIDTTSIHDASPELQWDEALFSETPSRIILTIHPDHQETVENHFEGLPLLYLGTVTQDPNLSIKDSFGEIRIQTTVSALQDAWSRPPAACFREEMLV